jgi:hypothetical protein
MTFLFLRRFVVASLLFAGLGSPFPGLTQGNEIKEVPMTVVTIPVPANGQKPAGIEQKLIQLTDSGKLPISPSNISTQNQSIDLGGGTLNQPLQVNTSLGYGQALDTDYRYAGKTGAPICGGFWLGRLQPKCPPEPAIFIAEAVGACPAGSFLDAGSGSCWSCPDGYNRTADPIGGSTACSKADASVSLKRMAGAKAGDFCPSGSFFDPIRGGECYSCPSGYKRSAAHIDADNACFVPAGEQLVRATRIQNTALPHECGKFAGSFHDTWDGGACWRCPAGFNRTGNHIDSNQGCSRSVPEQHARATPKGVAQCKAGEFHDPRNGGECWTCPAGTYRTVFPVDGKEACEQRAGVRLAKAIQVSAFSCPAGSFLDLISSRDPFARARIEKQIAVTGTKVSYGTSLGGTCWTCPPGYDRDLTHVASDSACTTRSIKWQPAPYVQPGLLGLAGSREVAIALLTDRRSIEELIVALAEDTGTPLAQMRMETYAEIARSPQTSALLAAAMYKRIEAAVLTPAQATADERRLAAGLAEAIRQYRIFIAQNAIDAYDQWVEARGRQLASDAQKAGAASLEQQRQNMVAFKGGEIPPDFMEIVGELVVLNVIAPAAMQSFLSASTATPRLRHAIFPHRKTGDVIEKTREEVKVGKANSKMLKEGGEEGVEQLIKSSTKAKGKAATALSKAAGRVFRQAMKFGPQILADVAVEMIVGTVEHFEAVLNARPKLVTGLSTAKNPVDMLRELKADEGWLHREWSVALGAGDRGPLNTGEFATLAQAALESGTQVAKTGPKIAVNAAITKQTTEAVAGMSGKLGVFEFVTVVPWPAQLKPTGLQTPPGLPMHSSSQDDSGCPPQATPGSQCKQRFRVRIDTRSHCNFSGNYLAQFEVVCRPGGACKNGWAEVPLTLGNASTCN